MSPTSNLKFDRKAALPVVDFHPRMIFSMEKFVFCGWPTPVYSHLFPKLAGQKLLKSCWPSERKVNCGELPVEKTLLGLPHIVEVASETWPNPRVKMSSTLARSFQQEPCWEMDVMSNVNFALSSKNQDQLRDLHNYLNH